MSQPASPSRDSVRAIDRAFDVLEALAAGPVPAATLDIAERTGLPQPTVHRILRTLTARSYVRQASDRRYSPGTALIPLARQSGSALGAVLQPMLVDAVEATRESVSVAVLDHGQVRYIAHAASDQSVRVFNEVGNMASLHSTGVGKAILSAMSDEQAETIVGQLALIRSTPNTITDPAVLLAQIRKARSQGYALDDAEYEIGVMCVAAPIPCRIPLAVSISGPQPRMTASFLRQTCLPVLRRLLAELGQACDQSSQLP